MLVDGDCGWVYEDFQDEIEAHPATALDGAFDVARVKCFGMREGDPPVMLGPYRHVINEDDL